MFSTLNEFTVADIPVHKWLTLTISYKSPMYLTPLLKFQVNKINAKMAHEELWYFGRFS